MERYGALQGLSKVDIAEKYGVEQVSHPPLAANLEEVGVHSFELIDSIDSIASLMCR